MKNLKAVDSGEKRHPCAGDVQFTKHDWAPGIGAIGRFDPRGTQFRPCAWELIDGVCTREGCKSSHGDEMKETIAGYPAGWHTWLRAVQAPSHSFKTGSETKAADTALWISSDLRDEVVESKAELKAAVESMKGDLPKEFATSYNPQGSSIGTLEGFGSGPSYQGGDAHGARPVHVALPACTRAKGQTHR